MHGIETILKPPYIRQTPSPVFTVDGQARQYVANDGYGWGSEFQRIEEILEEPDIRRGKLLAANAYLIDARALFAAALLKMWAERIPRSSVAGRLVFHMAAIPYILEVIFWPTFSGDSTSGIPFLAILSKEK